MSQLGKFLGASGAAALTSGLMLSPALGFWLAVLDYRLGFWMALSNGALATVMMLLLLPITISAFFIGSLCFGTPLFLAMTKTGHTGVITTAALGAILSGGVAWLLFGYLGGDSWAPPVAVSGAIGALTFRAVARQPKPPPAPPSAEPRP
ncbi:hypothetical protein [Brevundimonas nasdae]|uniref:Uncharacterized protein n=1 Tax=Brevundimonas nasdae TaxID=172043 RepID=A0ACD4VNK7_9CAUL|nr:hypothetical protein [Brevundimonas nasdae]WOB78864.1 hypothetical protein PZA08_01495 [Brevundimonas nasdae]